MSTCQNVECGNLFRIVGDTINSPHEMLIFDCYELIEQKHYMNSILSLAQAYEIFFSLFFRVELLYKPFGADPCRRLDDLNRLAEDLQQKIKDLTFAGMRALFLQHIVSGCSPKNLAEAGAVVAILPNRPTDPKDAAIKSLGDTKLVPLLMALKGTSIHTRRNLVVHKQAYRPTRQEVEAALKETRGILFPLTRHLRLYDNVNWYMKER